MSNYVSTNTIERAIDEAECQGFCFSNYMNELSNDKEISSGYVALGRSVYEDSSSHDRVMLLEEVTCSFMSGKDHLILTDAQEYASTVFEAIAMLLESEFDEAKNDLNWENAKLSEV